MTDITQANNLVRKAKESSTITEEEAGFVVSLVEKFRLELEKKTKQLHLLQGEISQLRANEQVIMDLIRNMIAATERDLARQENAKKLKAARG